MVRGKLLTPLINARHMRSEEVLMLAVLEQAFADLDGDCPAVRADAEAYFLAYESDSSVFSLDAVCQLFRLSPGAIRDEVRRKLGKHPAVRLASLENAA